MSESKNTTPLKLAMVLDTYDDARNGAVISTQRFTKLLRENGNEVIVVSTGKEESGKVVLKEFYPPIPIVRGVMERMKFIFAWPDKQKLKEVISNVDLVHSHFTFILAFQTIKIAKQLNKPIVSTFHVQAEQIANNVGLTSPWIISFIYKIFIKFFYNKSDLVICPSQFASDEIKRYGCTASTVVISNGVTEEYQEKNLEKHQRFTILTVGRNAAEKRQEILIQAVANSKHKDKIDIQIIGDGPKRQNLENLANQLLPGQVEFNYLPTQQVIDYYNKAHLYVHCAAVEVECMTVTEAMACGLPIIIAESELSATKQFALNQDYLFKTVAELTSKIDYLFENRNILEEAKVAYLKKVEQYKIKNSYLKLVEAYKSVIK